MDHPEAGATASSDSHLRTRRLSSRALFGDRNEVVIVHNNEDYRLRITSNGKLILTK
ncbi:MAG: hemin uptake protein HemP [Gammaproteobacteria bacterium]